MVAEDLKNHLLIPEWHQQPAPAAGRQCSGFIPNLVGSREAALAMPFRHQIKNYWVFLNTVPLSSMAAMPTPDRT
jgi:hypothetical protein